MATKNYFQTTTYHGLAFQLAFYPLDERKIAARLPDRMKIERERQPNEHIN